MATAEIITHIPGIVKVRAIENPDSLTGLKRERAAVGFHVVRRRAGDVFEINRWQEFSPRWMEFVEPSQVPAEWLEHIEEREAQRAARLQEAALQESKKPSDIQAEWIKRAVEQTVSTLSQAQRMGAPAGRMASHEFDHAGGKRRGRPAKAPSGEQAA